MYLEPYTVVWQADAGYADVYQTPSRFSSLEEALKYCESLSGDRDVYILEQSENNRITKLWPVYICTTKEAKVLLE